MGDGIHATAHRVNVTGSRLHSVADRFRRAISEESRGVVVVRLARPRELYTG